MTTTSSPPPLDHIVEISLFGPGFGESLVAHVGFGDWVIVDSCRARSHPESVPLAYLRDLGVDVASAVKLVVATHAHDDHIRGIADVLEACQSADFVHPLASRHEDFLTLVEIDRQLPGGIYRSYAEYARIVDTLLQRRAERGRKPRQIAIEGRTLHRRHATGTDPGAAVIALAPSDAATDMAIREFGNRIPTDEDTPRRVSSRDPNTFCVALWIAVGGVRALLGSDLLTGPGTDCGWRGILGSPTKPTEKASCFKVPHHGAPNAHYPDVWIELLEPNPVAMVAPYRAGRVARPDLADAARICGLTSRTYITSSPRVPSQPDASRRVASRLRSIASNVRLLYGYTGQVRARRDCTDSSADWDVELIWPAADLCAET